MKTTSNPGPRWGYTFIASVHKLLPKPAFRALLAAGTVIGLLVMTRQRRASRAYWLALTGERPGPVRLFRHFFAFMDNLVLKLAVRHAPPPSFQFAPEAHREAFVKLCASDGPALFGTFHVGCSDMMGCLLSDFGRRVSLVRLRVGNSLDTDILESLFKGMVRFIWINQPEEFLFSLKQAIEAGESIGLQCDRVEFGARLEPFTFLGRRRMFPFTIYHLSALFRIPVVFAFTGPVSPGGTVQIVTSPVFEPHGGRELVLAAARMHFQRVLQSLERHLRVHPELWFNFIPLNPPVNGQA